MTEKNKEIIKAVSPPLKVDVVDSTKSILTEKQIKQAKPSVKVEGEPPNTKRDRVITIHEVCPKCGSPSSMLIDIKAVDNLYKALSTAKPVVFRIPFRTHLASNPEAEEVILPKPTPQTERKKYFNSALQAFKKGEPHPSPPPPSTPAEPQP